MGRTDMSGDPFTGDLFAIPQPSAPLPASHDYRPQVAHLVGETLRASGLDRYRVAAEMSRLTGREITKTMLDAYASEGRETFNLPFWEVPALEAACQSHGLGCWLAQVRGGRLLVGRETLTAELGRLEQARDTAAKRIRDIKRLMGEGE